MSNINKLKLLINLLGNEKNSQCNVSINAKLDKHVLQDLDNFQKFKTTEDNERFRMILNDEFQCPGSNPDDPTIWTYATSIFEILLYIDNELEHHEDLPITVNDTQKIHNGIRKCIEYGLKPYLLADSVPIKLRLPNIITSTKILIKIVNNKFFPLLCARNDQHLVYTDLLSSIFTILCTASDEIVSYFEESLHYIRLKISHADYFKILFLIMGCNKSPSGQLIQQIVHKQLKQTLYEPRSFEAICEALLPPITSLEQDEEIVRKRLHSCSVISSIVAQKKHGNKFHRQIIDEICEHLLKFIRNNKSNHLHFTDAGVQCLSKLYSLQSVYIHRLLQERLLKTFNELATPSDLVVGSIVCDENEFLEAIRMLNLTCASGPSDSIPSELLKPFVPLLIQVFHILVESENKSLKNDVLAVIVRCLSNRSRPDLNRIIECVLYEEYADFFRRLHLHLRIEHINNGANASVRFIVAARIDENENDNDLDMEKFLKPSVSLVNMLKQSNHNRLIYDAFLHILQMFSELFGPSSSSGELLESEIELEQAIEMKFKKIIYQFVESPNDIISMLDKMIHQQMEQIEVHVSEQKMLSDEFEEVLVVILLCAGEFILRLKNQEVKKQLEKTLKKLKLQLQSQQVNHIMSMDKAMKKLNSILDVGTKSNENSEFLRFKAILNESCSEPYTKVYGIMNMIKLIEGKDDEACSNAHIILILAMKLLKEEDSYIFLNCIKLLISLFGVLECTVLETLIAEYHTDIEADTNDIDFKLKIGEALIKVMQGLGEMCYKFKDTLINCFLKGIYIRHDELRTSNMSNLGIVMQNLSYQVHHFFQEVMILIENTILHDKYLPARRAAAVVLTDLLRGMESLEQYQEFLLPIYRTLKNIGDHDSDLHMQIHELNGLECLKEKVKDTFRSPKMEKEIRIFDAKEENFPIQYK